MAVQRIDDITPGVIPEYESRVWVGPYNEARAQMSGHMLLWKLIIFTPKFTI